MTPRPMNIAFLLSFLLLLSCSSPKLEQITGLPQKTTTDSETQPDVNDKKDAASTRRSLAASDETRTPVRQLEPPPLAPPMSEPVPPPENGANGSNGDLNGGDEENGKDVVRSQTGTSQRTREAQEARPKVDITERGIKLPELPPLDGPGTESFEATVINPYRTANVATEISGMIDSFVPEEGELVREGQVVCEVSKSRYALLAERAAEDVKGLRLAAVRAEQSFKIMQDMFAQDAVTKQDLLKAQTEFEMARTAVEKAIKEHEVAELNLEACQVRAPFKGYIAVKYKQTFEPIERLEKIFAIVDTAKVYAVANMPETELGLVKKGISASFVDTQGLKYTGSVEKIGAMIDPKSRTKRIWVLIDNSNGKLVVGMVGTLQIEKPEDK